MSRQKKNRRAPSRKKPETAQTEALLIWGVNPIKELLLRKPEQLKKIFTQGLRDDRRCREIIELARERDIPVSDQAAEHSPPPEARHQGFIAELKPFPMLTIDELIKKLSPKLSTNINPALSSNEPTPGEQQQPLVLLLDSIQDPHNLGAVLRSAAAFAVDGIIIAKDHSAPLSGTVMKASAGTLHLLDICRVSNLVEAISRLKEAGLWVYGAAGAETTDIKDAEDRQETPGDNPGDGYKRQAARPNKRAGSALEKTTDYQRQPRLELYKTSFTGPVCLVMGNEQKGIRPLIRSHCDFLVSIPLAAGVESLNVSVATGIILSEIRRPSDPPAQQCC